MSDDWHYFATRLNGDGTEDLLATDLPLSNVEPQRALSGPGGLSATIPVEVPRLMEGGRPIFRPWSTALYAERNGFIVAAGILTPDGFAMEGGSLTLECVGWSGYLDGMPYDEDRSWVDIDPAALVRHAWNHVQVKPGGNIGLEVDPTTTPVRIGEPERDVSFSTGDGQEVEFTAGPVKWNWWSTHDLGREVDQLAEDTPIEYLLHHWRDGETIRHRLQLGHPRIGRRQSDLRFVVGENIAPIPAVESHDWTSQVVVLGAGEGRQMRRGTSSERLVGRLRRPMVIVDKTLRSDRACEREAATQARWRTGRDNVSEIMLIDHANAPLGSWSPGDEILIQGNDQGWAGGLYGWHRVLSETWNIERGQATLSVTRAEGA